jgi:hypothetical protein
VCDAQGLCTCWSNSPDTQLPACYNPAAYNCPQGTQLLSSPEASGSCFIRHSSSTNPDVTTTSSSSTTHSRMLPAQGSDRMPVKDPALSPSDRRAAAAQAQLQPAPGGCECNFILEPSRKPSFTACCQPYGCHSHKQYGLLHSMHACWQKGWLWGHLCRGSSPTSNIHWHAL